jgi:hypothetical protein
MRISNQVIVASVVASSLSILLCNDGWTQGRGGRDGAPGRSPGNRSAAAPSAAHSGPAMSRPSSGPGAGAGAGRVGNNTPAGVRPGGGNDRPNLGGASAGAGKAPGNFQRPNAGGGGDGRPNLGAAGGDGRPNLGGDRPGAGSTGGLANRPGNVTRPGGASSSQVGDFLGLGGNAGAAGDKRPQLGNLDRPNQGNDKLPGLGKNDSGIKDRLPGTKDDVKDRLPGDVGKNLKPDNQRPDINVGNVNIGNSIDYSKDQKAWVNNRHTTGNQVRVNSGNRYATAYNTWAYRRGVVGGYPYYNSWGARGPYYGWTAASYVAFGTFMGAAWTRPQPVYYAYGTGGNVYYENNTVYVNGTASGTPEQYAQQLQTAVAAAPATVTDTEWLPLGTFAYTREGVDDSNAMIELAVNKEGVIAGIYYNETTGVSRSLKGTVDKATQRVAIGFADGKNENVVLETGIYNLTQDEAPGMIHMGSAEAEPVLLVKLQAPKE